MKKGKYEIFNVGEEKVVSESRDKIKKYAEEKGVEKIEYRMSVNNIKGLGDEYKKI
mgnify:CR=1 FL=1